MPNVVTMVEAVRCTVVQVLSKETTAGEGRPDHHECDCWLDLMPAEDHRKMAEVVADRQQTTAALSDATTLAAWAADRHDVASGVCCCRRELVNFVAMMEAVGIGASTAVADDAVATEIAVVAVDAVVAVVVAAPGAADEIEDEAVDRIEVLDREMVVHLLVPCASLAWPAGAAFEL